MKKRIFFSSLHPVSIKLQYIITDKYRKKERDLRGKKTSPIYQSRGGLGNVTEINGLM